jgi:hypothetical protein
VNAEHRATQRQDVLTSERAAIKVELTELHHRKYALEMERPIMIDLTKAQAQARATAAAINREGAPHPTFTRASQNMAAVAALLDTLSAPSSDGVDKVYRQFNDILGITATQ